MIYADYQDIGNKAFKYSDKIEQLQKENEELKAKLEYKQYGDLDNIEFEKYINDIVENRTKELKEQLEEEQELNKIIKETRINKVLENNIEVKKLREENNKLKEQFATYVKMSSEVVVNSILIPKLKEDILNPMKEAHDKAIKGFIETDAPELCGIYSTIAQELGYFIGKMEELIKEGSNK